MVNREDCTYIDTLLVAFAEDELAGPEAQLVDRHVLGCTRCRAALADERQLTSELTNTGRPAGRDADRYAGRKPVAVAASRTDGSSMERTSRRRRGAAVLLAGLVIAALNLPTEAPAYGSIVSTELSRDLDNETRTWEQADEDQLKASNHVQIPAGVSADLNIAGVGTIHAVGSASFELDFVEERWKATIHRGRLTVHVMEGATLVVARSNGQTTLTEGDHTVSATVSDEPAADALGRGLTAFIDMDFELAVTELAQAANNSGVNREQEVQALFYLAAAEANLDRHADVIRSVDRWLAIADESEKSGLTAEFWKAGCLAEVGRTDEANALYERLIALNPEHPYAPGARRQIDSAPSRVAEPAPTEEPQPKEPDTTFLTTPADSRIAWSFPLTAPTFGSAAAADIDGDGHDEIAFGTYFGDRHLYVLNAEDGTLAWKALTKSGPRDASVLIHDVDGDGELEVLSADSATGLLECFDGKGATKWAIKLPSGTDSPAAAADMDGDGDVEIAIGTMKVYADGKDNAQGRLCILDGKSGAMVWSVKIPGHIQSEPTLVDLNADGTLDVLVNTWMGDGILRAFDGIDGKLLWTFETADWIYHGTSAHDFDGDGRPEIVVADRRGNVWMLQGEDGAEGWKATLSGEAEGMVFGPTTLVDVDGDGTFEIVAAGRGVHVLDATGKVLWERQFGSTSIARGVSVGDVTGDGKAELVFGAGKRLVGLDPATGEELFGIELGTSDDPREDIETPPLIFDALGDERLEVFVVIGRGLYEGMESNFGHAVLVKTEGRGTPEWRTFRGGPARRGSVLQPSADER